MNIQENVDIKNYTTFKIGGQFRYFTVIQNKEEFLEALDFAEKNKLKIFILGGGSNIICSDEILGVLAVKMEIKGFEISKETNEYTDIKISAGEIWDEVVAKTVEMKLTGLEALSAIPGTVGATPVQNVGAYGAEVKDTILEVEVFDTRDKKIKTLSNQDCKFRYRDSIFKNEAKGRYIIVSVTYRLTKSFPKIPDYPGIKRYFLDNNVNNPHLEEIREAVIYIRNEKLPNPKELPNVGSFFENPIVSKEIAGTLKNKYSDLKTFSTGDGQVKIPAGWLVDKAGLKGKSFGKISTYEKNALVLVNNGEATKEDLIKAKNEIIKIVQEKFGITLEQEPEII